MHGKALARHRLTDAQRRRAVGPEITIVYWWNDLEQALEQTGAARHQAGRSYIQVCRVDLLMQEIRLSGDIGVVSPPQGKTRK